MRARILWNDNTGERDTEWCELTFHVADEEVCDRESRDPQALHWVGLHHAARACRLASQAMRANDLPKALTVLGSAMRRLSRYAEGDAELERALEGLREMESKIKVGKLTVGAQKEARYQATMASRGQRDHRGA